MRPVIGITPLMDTKLDSYWMLPDYMQAVQQAGGLPLMLPFQYDEESLDQMVELCDGLVFTGGEDIDPSWYHAERLPVCGESIPIRDELEIRLLRAALAAKKPVLCICRGLQLFNVVMGGTLWQDLPASAPLRSSIPRASPMALPPTLWNWFRAVRSMPCWDSPPSASIPVTIRPSGNWLPVWQSWQLRRTA